MSEFEAGFVAEPASKDVLQTIWEQANKSYNNNCGPPARSFATADDIRQLNEVSNERVQSVLSRIKLYPPYDSHQTNIYNVRISKLVTPQITINLARAEERTEAKQGMTEAELFNLSFESAGQPQHITRQVLDMVPNGGALLFTSYDEDIRLHHPPEYRKISINEKDPLSPTFESVCLPVGGGLPFASAYRIQIVPGVTRLILNNGIHRMYRLASAGYDWCPLAVCDLVPMELPEPFVNLPRDFLLNVNSNPPLITDFLNNNVVIPLSYFTLLKTVRLNWNFEQYLTVLK